MSLKAKIEAIVYAAETPVTLDQIVNLVKESAGETEPAEFRSQTPSMRKRRKIMPGNWHPNNFNGG